MRTKHFLAAAVACLIILVIVLAWWTPRLLQERLARQQAAADAVTTATTSDAATATAPEAAGTEATGDGVVISDAPADETSADSTVSTPGSGGESESPAAVVDPEPLSPDRVAAIMLSGPGGGDTIQLRRDEGSWLLDGDPAAPADNAKIAALLDALLNAPRDPADVPPENVGLADGEGVRINLLDDNGMVGASLRIGLRPEGDFESAYLEDGETVGTQLAHADLRGLLGLWRNTPDDSSRAVDWLSTRLVSFDPETVTRVTLVQPDHEFTLSRVGDSWTVDADPAVADPDPAELRRWLADLSDFRVDAKRPLTADGDWEDAPFGLRLELDGGGTVDVAVQMNPFAGGMAAVASTRPGLAYALPVWRARAYFDRADKLFRLRETPFAGEDIRFIDIRRDGESVKLQNRDGAWLAPNSAYPLLPGRAEQVAEAVTGFRPVSPARLATPGGMPLVGNPAVEITLADGAVVQYRLGGFHPVFPRRYVLVNNAKLFAVDAADVGVLFPQFSQFLELGPVFNDIDAATLSRLDMATPEGRLLLSLERREDGWVAVTGQGEEPLLEGEEAQLVTAPAAWRIVGFFSSGPEPFMATQGGIQIRLSDDDTARAILLLPPQDGVSPVLRDDRQTFTFSEIDLAEWFGHLGALNKRVSARIAERLAAEEAMRAAAEAAAADEARQVESARAEEEDAAVAPEDATEADDVADDAVEAPEAAAPEPEEELPREPEAVVESNTYEAEESLSPEHEPEPEAEAEIETEAPVQPEPQVPEEQSDSVDSDPEPETPEADLAPEPESEPVTEPLPDDSVQDNDAGEFAPAEEARAEPEQAPESTENIEPAATQE